MLAKNWINSVRCLVSRKFIIRIGSFNCYTAVNLCLQKGAAAKLKKAQDLLNKVLQLTQKNYIEILSNLSSSINNDLFKTRDINSALVVVVSSDKGLCGSFDSSFNQGV